MKHGLLAVFIEWKKDEHEKFEYIGIYTNDTATLFTKDAKKVADYLGIIKYRLVAILSQVNELHPHVADNKKEGNTYWIDAYDINGNPTEVTENEMNKMNESISTMLKNANHDPPSEEDARAILKDAEKI